MLTVTTRPLQLRHLSSLRRQFVKATHESFGYIGSRDRAHIIQENDLPNLIKAWGNRFRLLQAAYQNGQLVGYAIASIDHGVGTLYWMYVDPEYRGNKVGDALLRDVRDWCIKHRAHRLVLATHNTERYYQRQGFQVAETRKLHGVDMKIMVLELQP